MEMDDSEYFEMEDFDNYDFDEEDFMKEMLYQPTQEVTLEENELLHLKRQRDDVISGDSDNEITKKHRTEAKPNTDDLLYVKNSASDFFFQDKFPTNNYHFLSLRFLSDNLYKSRHSNSFINSGKTITPRAVGVSTHPDTNKEMIRSVGYGDTDRPLYLRTLDKEELGALRKSVLDFQLNLNDDEFDLKASSRPLNIDYVAKEKLLEEENEELIFTQELVEHQNWVDKYKPKYYSDLLQEEKIKLEVLKWLKAWDPLVFKKPTTTKKISDKDKRTDGDILHGLPRVLLIGGPPGVGKSSLIDVIAKHCGYDKFEINASDERTKDRLMPLLLGVVGTAGVGINTNNKMGPNDNSENSTKFTHKATICVLEEIDGIASTSKSSESKDVCTAIVDLMNKKDSKGKPVIKRPVICVCNDLWHKNLRPLRSRAKVVYVQHPSAELLQNRISAILERENFKADQNFINRLINLHTLDIRSTLSTLQLITRGKQKQRILKVSDLDIYQTNKDREESQTYLIDLTFSGQNSYYTTNSMRSRRFNEIFDFILNNSSSTTHQGFTSLFEENYTLATYTDGRMLKTSYLVDLLSQSDYLSSHSTHSSTLYTSDYTSSYTQLCPFLCASMFCGGNHQNAYWRFMSMSLERFCVQQKHTHLECVKSLILGALPNLSHTLLKSSLHTQTTPHLIQLILLDESNHFKLWYKPHILLKSQLPYSNNLCVFGPRIPKFEIPNKNFYLISSLIGFLRILSLLYCYGLNFSEVVNKHTQQQSEITLHIDPLLKLSKIYTHYSLDPPIHLFNTFDCSVRQYLQLNAHKFKQSNYEQTNITHIKPYRQTHTHPMKGWNDKLCKIFMESKSQFFQTKNGKEITHQIHTLLTKGINHFTHTHTHIFSEETNKTTVGITPNLNEAHTHWLDHVNYTLPFEQLISSAYQISQIIESKPLLSEEISLPQENNQKTSNLYDLAILCVPTNGYIRYESGRCNAVKLPLTLDF